MSFYYRRKLRKIGKALLEGRITESQARAWWAG
jgi:hypothetical protein